MTNIKTILHNDKGVASILVALTMTTIMAFTALAVDIGQIHLKRGALQTAADAGALAGANSLLAQGKDFDQLRTIVKTYAYKNMLDKDVPTSALTDPDIVFMKDGVPTEEDPNQVEVTIMLNSLRNNPLTLYFGGIIGTPTVNLKVVSRAGIVGICSSKCVKPFVVPTKFDWDDSAAPGTQYYENGEMDVDSPAEVNSINVVGYDQNDIGTQIIIKPGDPSLAITPGQYNLVDLPPINKGNPVTGGDALRDNIAGCSGSNGEYAVGPGDELQLEPGNSQGPVKQGTEDLLNTDPFAYWDPSTEAIEGSQYSDPMDSPRMVIMAFYDPRQPPQSGRNSVTIYELGAFFIEDVDNQGNVTARFMNAAAYDPESTDSSDCMLRISRVMLDSSRQ